MCLLIEKRVGEGGRERGGGNTEPPGMPSTGLVNYCHSAISRPLNRPHVSCSPRKTKTAAAASEGTIPPPVFNLCCSFFLSHLLSFTVLCPLPITSPLSPPSCSSPTLLHQSISGYFVSQLYRELLLMTTITVVYFLREPGPLYARRASITL